MNYKIKNSIALRFTMLLVIFLMGFSGCTDFLKEVPTGSLTTAADLTGIEYKEPFTVGPYRRLQDWTSGAGDGEINIPSPMNYLIVEANPLDPQVRLDKFITN